ncbi:iron chelate uptake ABC transporter family permease subunit [Phytohabitans suffuscus]|uniref:Recombinase domain-containing protein n=1 Tax=Phytohabitans suffuscus TaxID=624315 RepID=A0A6F8YRT4_9ACTN|nr:iron chelate uptake ABC transporter family permease subunit [Phytohabitans suffuscus]BCB88860.1 hypothetical protein Psuf_061730 [Phytohabitans suffuscus]
MAAHQPATPPAGGLTAAGTIGPGGAGPASPWAAISKLSGLDTVAVAGLLRVSQEQLQDVRGSLIRQVDNITRALPAGWHVVAWFIDIESGRLEFDERGHGTGHLNIVLPVERDGGLPELLEEAKRRDCRFSAVVAENAERLARYTYFGTKVEHELGKHGIELFAADEGIQLDGKKAAKVLMRRMKQAIGEFHAINVMEQAWEGTKVHTQEGYNIGRVPYGYTAVKEPHPAPARRSRGLTRTRLAVDPVRGPVITQIFYWRVVDRLTYRQIAKRLNEDPGQYPPPDPRYNGKPVGVGQWTITNVRVLLQNPKYTGHMVWNRTTSRVGVTVRRKKTHRPNPVEQWVWSKQPTHTPLITLDTYQQAQKMSSDHQGSRTTGGTNTHPATRHTYLYRGLLRCGYCGWRMHGTQANGLVYYKCRGPRNTAGKPRDPDHPRTLSIREDALTPAIANLITTRIFGPERQAHLHHQHVALPRERAEQHARATDVASKSVENITNRQRNLMTELEQTPADDHAYRAGIRQRYRELDQQRAQAEAALAELIATQPVVDEGMPELLATMPYASANLAAVPAAIQRRLFDALKLTVRVDNPRRAHVRITLTADTPDATAEVVADIETDAAHDPGPTPSPPPSIGTVFEDPDQAASKLVHPVQSGIGVSALLEAVNAYLITRADLANAETVQRWQLGSLNGTQWQALATPAIVLAVAAVASLALSRPLTILELGDDTARALGVRARFTRTGAACVAVTLVAAATAVAGPVIFIALAAPHIAKKLTRTAGPGLMPSALTGILAMTASDLAAQRLVAPLQLPVGVGTAAIGGIYLAWLLAAELRRQQ